MLELSLSRKNRVHLGDYNYEKDVHNRLLMSRFTASDVAVLEEIIYGSLRIPIRQLKNNLGIDFEQLHTILGNLEVTGLFTQDGDVLLVDKEVRKYFDQQMEKFDEDFRPDMQYLQSLLRKVPIHVLPTWYMVPRTSNNIFASIVERYLQTPQVFERYLNELHFAEAILNDILQVIYTAPQQTISALELQNQFALTDEQLQEYLIFLEFNLVACVYYEKEGTAYREMVAPYSEWKEYIQFKRSVDPKELVEQHKVTLKRLDPFYFIKDMSLLLQLIVQKPMELLPSVNERDYLLPDAMVRYLSEMCEDCSPDNADDIVAWQLYFSRVIDRLVLIGLLQRHEDMLTPKRHAPHWMNMSIEDRALYLYRHPENRTLDMGYSLEIDSERNVREIEKALDVLVQKRWVYLDDVIAAMTSSIGNALPVTLCKQGGKWEYAIPTYSEEEKCFIRDVIINRLAEVGIVQVGLYHDRTCIALTAFGKETLF